MHLHTALGGLACLLVLSNASPIAQSDGEQDIAQALQERNILIPYTWLIQTVTPDPATWTGTGEQTVSPARVATSTVDIATDTAAAAKRDVTPCPDLVPSVEVDLATDTTGTRTISGDLLPTSVVQLGTTTGCIVTMSSNSFVTQCSNAITTPTPTGIANCCGSSDQIYPCNDAGTIPTGSQQWLCTLGSSTCAGTSTATTTWV